MTEQLTIAWDLDPVEARVLHALHTHRGSARAIKVPDLAHELGLDGRLIQKTVKRLREEHGAPIGSTASHVGPGYYLIESIAELQAFMREQRKKAISTLVMVRRMRQHGPRLLGQLAMEVPS